LAVLISAKDMEPAALAREHADGAAADGMFKIRRNEFLSLCGEFLIGWIAAGA
jgi:hypothetical protein